jgi:hypothetical protein
MGQACALCSLSLLGSRARAHSHCFAVSSASNEEPPKSVKAIILNQELPSYDLVPLGHSRIFTFPCVLDSSSQNIDLLRRSRIGSIRIGKPSLGNVCLSRPVTILRLYISQGLAWVSVSRFSVAEGCRVGCK